MTRWIIPTSHRLKLKWDLSLGALIFYSVLIIPYRIGFAVESSPVENAFDIIVDVFFFLDMFANFRTSFVNSEGIYDTIPTSIRNQYLRSWFTVDFFSTFPIDRIV